MDVVKEKERFDFSNVVVSGDIRRCDCFTTDLSSTMLLSGIVRQSPVSDCNHTVLSGWVTPSVPV